MAELRAPEIAWSRCENQSVLDNLPSALLPQQSATLALPRALLLQFELGQAFFHRLPNKRRVEAEPLNLNGADPPQTRAFTRALVGPQCCGEPSRFDRSIRPSSERLPWRSAEQRKVTMAYCGSPSSSHWKMSSSRCLVLNYWPVLHTRSAKLNRWHARFHPAAIRDNPRASRHRPPAWLP